MAGKIELENTTDKAKNKLPDMAIKRRGGRNDIGELLNYLAPECAGLGLVSSQENMTKAGSKVWNI
jgi:hypothetical protein